MRNGLSLLVLLCYTLIRLPITLADEDPPEITSTTDNKKRPVLSFAESIKLSQRFFQDPEIEAARKQYWRRTFADIRNLTVTSFDRSPGSNSKSGQRFLSQWKLLLDDAFGDEQEENGQIVKSTNDTTMISTAPKTTTRRFEGFPSWDRLLQDWAEDVQEYLERAQLDSEGGYSMASFGRPTSTAKENLTLTETNDTVASEFDVEQEEPIALVEAVEPIEKKKKVLPKPAPAKPGEKVLPHTDLSDKSKRILIVTTASLPWKTGTAVNPLLRAAYMTEGRKEAGGSVTLMLPWLERKLDQERVYGSDNMFETPEDQEEYVRTWLRESAGMKQASEELNIQWYTAWQNKVENSIYSMGDITALIPDGTIDICILEEPEHLNWYRAPGESWTKKFKHVVGILHTNYFSYAMDQPAALIRAPAMRLLCSWMCRAHCHRVIKLSGTLDKVAPEKELVENVHGVRGTFLDVGAEVRRRLDASRDDPMFGPTAEPKVYFIGKMLWSKGLGSLMELLKYAEESANLNISVDMYGGGPDKDAAAEKAIKLGLDMPFHGPLDHAELAYTHKIFVNPSTSEVLCTTSAEALAMGKFVILPSHPSNDFFAQFPNCLTYATKEEFVGNLYYALTHSPEPLAGEYAHALTWKAATERLEAAGCITEEEAAQMADALSSEDAGIEITLPPLVDSEEGRKAIATTLRFTRLRYRQFRTRLSNELQQSKVLPKALRERLVAELDKRLDLDIDEILESPKLRLALSPAELDKSLLQLYDKISESPSGDILRLIGGGGPIGLQNLYMKRKAERERRREMQNGKTLDLFPAYADEFDILDEEKNPTEKIRWALRHNLPQLKPINNRKSNDVNTPSMCLGYHQSSSCLPTSWSGFRSPQSLRPFASKRNAKFSVLI